MMCAAGWKGAFAIDAIAHGDGACSCAVIPRCAANVRLISGIIAFVCRVSYRPGLLPSRGRDAAGVSVEPLGRASPSIRVAARLVAAIDGIFGASQRRLFLCFLAAVCSLRVYRPLVRRRPAVAHYSLWTWRGSLRRFFVITVHRNGGALALDPLAVSGSAS
jgi:hypothetical protein